VDGVITTTAAEQLVRGSGDELPRVLLDAAERTAVGDLVELVLDEDPERPVEDRLDRVAVYAHELPPRLRTVLTEFRITGRPFGGLGLSGLPINKAAVGPTPRAYSEAVGGRESARAGALLLLIGSLLGDPFSYLSQRNGKLVLDVFPVRGHEWEQLGSSSTTNLEWHNEDAFHPMRADWIMLFCLRNLDGVATTFAPIQHVELDRATRDVLFEDRFVILPDESHTAAFNTATTGVDDGEGVRRAFAQIAEMTSAPPRTPILSGDPEVPYLRIDPAFMQRDLGDPVAERALETVIGAIDQRLEDVVLAPGEMLIVDNKRAVHGRRPFQARYDGTDRWLRRINVTADLGKSAGRRFGSHQRAVV
jgi:Fe(II)/alpha-ketoglutarate-dependent arginine beta-hydroxylase